jgi:hypothetical protein
MIRLLISSLVIFLIGACDWRKSTETPAAFLYVDTTSKEVYIETKSFLTDSMRYFILGNKDPYYSKEYDSETAVEIDTIIFSPVTDKFFFIAIAKNSNDKLLSRGDKNEFHYDGYSFIARKNEFGNWDIKWLSAYNFINHGSAQKASANARKAHFETFAERNDVDGKSLYKYNVNDKRFWDGPVWELH